MNKFLFGALIVGSTLFAAGCSNYDSHSPNDPNAPIAGQSSSHVSTQAYQQTRGFDGAEGFSQTASNDQGLLNQRIYYFGYDNDHIKPEFRVAIEANADYLISHPQAHVRIEGHTDERGSREYNIALGERRAQAVANVLKAKGVKSNQINIVSFGKEKPASTGQTDHDYSKNRRGIIAYETN